MRILMSGPTSMIGLDLLNVILSKGHNVDILTRENGKNFNKLPVSDKIKIINVDLAKINLDLKNEITYDVFFHLAWINSGINRNSDFEKQLENVKMLSKLIKVFKFKKIIISGSQAEYGDNFENLIIEESEDVCPTSYYGSAKNICRMLVDFYSSKFDFKYIWTRIFSVYGINDRSDSLISTVIKSCYENKDLKLSSCNQQWEYIYSKDAADLLYRISLMKNPKKIYNISSKDKRKLKEFVNVIQKISGSKSKITFKDSNFDKIHNLNSSISNLESDIENYPFTDFNSGISEIIKNIGENHEWKN